MAVRSRRLSGPIVVPAGGVNTVIYTVPAGRTAVVRGCFVYNSLLLVNTVNLLTGIGSFWGHRFANAEFVQTVDREFVLNPGDVLVASSTTGANVTVFGSLLLGAPT